MKSVIVQIWLIFMGFYTVNCSINVAYRKPAWVSSRWISRVDASNVVNGTKYLDGPTFFSRCIHTLNERFPRWWVNMTGDFTISRIDIYWGGQNHRMIGYKLIVSNTETRNRWGRNHMITGHICHNETRLTPPLHQSVPCLVRGQYITYADNVAGAGDPYSYISLCEVEAYGCPTGWYGHNDCSVPCPKGCRDGVCNPDNGTCFTGCRIGLQGTACNRSCDYGRFGLDCQQYCFCLSGTCDTETGSCQDDICQPGWNGTACNQSCGLRTFGEKCLETCNCLQGSCDPANGTCYQEGCQPGWQTESCSLECDDGRFGHGCNGTCGACRGGSPCDKVTGICPQDCADGWTTHACNEACPAGTFGYNCSSECFCKTGPCDPTNGICPDNACDRGWYGTTCSSQCEPWTFGYDCVEICHCRVGPCNRTYGLCPTGGCKDGWKTDTCSKKSPNTELSSGDSKDIIIIVLAVVCGLLVLIVVGMYLRLKGSRDQNSGQPGPDTDYTPIDTRQVDPPHVYEMIVIQQES